MKDMFDRRLFCDILRKNWFWFVLSFFAAITNLLHDEGKAYILSLPVLAAGDENVHHGP